MKFNVVVLQYDGRVSEYREMAIDELRTNVIARHVTAAFEARIDEHLAHDRLGTIEFEQPFLPDSGGLLRWRQGDLFFANAAISLSGRVKFTWFYFSGIDPEADAIAVRIMSESLTQLTARTGMSGEDSLRSLAQRPLAVCIPWPPSASDIQRDYSGKLAILLGAAFFGKAIEMRERVEAKWKNRLDDWRGMAAEWSEN